MTRTSLPADGTYFRACNLCEAICGLQFTVSGGQVTDVRGDPADPLSRGHICPKGTALPDLHRDPNRLKKPLRRTGNQWAEMEWEDALDYVAQRLKDIVQAHSPDAVASFQGNPSVHNSGTMLSVGNLLRAVGSKNRFTATSTDQLPHQFAAAEMLGHPLLLPIPDLDRTDFLLMLGANPLASNGSIMTAPGMRERLKAIRDRGGRVVLLDPRRTESAQAATEFHFIRPASDAYFLLALLNVIFAEKLERLGHLAEFTDGLDDLKTLAAAFPPEAVEARTGVPAEVTRQLARDFARAPRAVAYGRIGLSVQEFGGLCQWLVNALNIVTGHFDTEGGAMFTRPAFDVLMRARRGETYFGRYHTRVRGLPEFDGELPSAAMTEEILTPGEGQIRALITVAGNPVLSTPGGDRLADALGTLDFMVSIDPYMNETTRHAHVILPPAFGLETDHYDMIFHHFAVRNTARYNRAIFPIDDQQRYDHQIFGGLAERLGGKAGSTPEQRLNLALRHGPYATTLNDLDAQAHGVDFGPLQPCLPQRLLTADGRLKLAPALLCQDAPRLTDQLGQQVEPLLLIGRRQLRSNNSWMHGVTRLMRGPDRCTLQLHPTDAPGWQSGDLIEVTSDTGQLQVPLELTEDLMPGVASLPHGFGHRDPETRVGLAAERPGVNINALTDPRRLDPLTGNAALNATPISVRRVSQAEA